LAGFSFRTTLGPPNENLQCPPTNDWDFSISSSVGAFRDFTQRLVSLDPKRGLGVGVVSGVAGFVPFAAALSRGLPFRHPLSSGVHPPQPPKPCLSVLTNLRPAFSLSRFFLIGQPGPIAVLTVGQHTQRPRTSVSASPYCRSVDEGSFLNFSPRPQALQPRRLFVAIDLSLLILRRALFSIQ